MRPAFDAIAGLFNRPCALADHARGRALALFSDWSAASRSDELSASVLAAAGAPQRALGNGRNGADWRPYEAIEGVALIPVRGVLIQRIGPWAWLGELIGVQGYDQIRAMFMQALADESVDAIALMVDSPGGDVAGCFDLVDTIYAGRGVKPIRAILDESAYSAAYAIASAADPGGITVPRTGGAGSIGVIALHVSLAGMLSQIGVEATEIFKGARKADFSELHSLTDEARARLQADVDATGAIFDQTVARNRKIPVADVRATEAGTFQGRLAVEAGLADAVAAPDAAFRALLKTLG